MSWQMLDGSSRRPRLSWAVPEHLRDNSRYGPFRRSAVPAPLDPDALLQYMDNAISIMENAQATKQLSLLFVSASSVAPSSSSAPSTSAAVLTSSSPSAISASSSSLSSSSRTDRGPPLLPLVPARKVSRFKSVPLQQTAYINSSPKGKDQEEATRLDPLVVSKTKDMEPLDEQGFIKTDSLSSISLLDKSESHRAEEESVSEVDQTPNKGEKYDAQAADNAYRAACGALSEGNAERALSLLHVALDKCPPHKQNALGKVHRLMAAAVQLVEKNSAVLRYLPVDKDT